MPIEDELADDYCEFAGDFFILGGPLEMPWTFNRPYYFDITKTVLQLGVALDGNYHVETEVYSVNGTQLPSDILPPPSVSFRLGTGKRDRKFIFYVYKKNVYFLKLFITIIFFFKHTLLINK